MEIIRINIRKIANGWVVDMEYDTGNDDDWLHEKFYFATIAETLAFIETNLD